MDAILVLNAGSSSIKFATFEHSASAAIPRLISLGHVAQVGSEVEFVVKDCSGTPLERSSAPSPQSGFDHSAAMATVFGWINTQRAELELVAVGHRVVHGGSKFLAPVRVDDEVLRNLDALVPLAPLHQPHNLRAIRALLQASPELPQVACFDTAFHSTQPRVAQAFALPREFSDAGVRRYGFHGLSYEYIATQLPRVLGDRAHGKVIVAHLGNGASLCALVDGKSVASTMGFSALDGLMMGTRCGTLDPGVVLYMLQELGMTAQEVDQMLYSRSGLLGLSGISGDMQILLASTDPRAAEAIDLFVYRIACEIGSLAAAMGGLDALVFTAGIGEHAAPIRHRVCLACKWLGATLNETANSNGEELIHAAASALRLAVVPTHEELMIAAHTLRATASGQPDSYQLRGSP
ncbi:MAG TPA: acetate/propionate family kinase [Acidiferrobacterales bacterium]|nr:acetate/propionate family kinase [Acidiferrobacterales bacterium]